jgi:fatty acid desaturase
MGAVVAEKEKPKSFWAADLPATFRSDAKIQWYRPKLDPQVMSQLIQRSNWRGLCQAMGHLGLWLATGAASYLAYRQISAATWFWSVPLLVVALFLHGTIGSFMGGTACHELSHNTPFRTRALNEFFHSVFAFLSWHDKVWFRPSHIRHHRVTVHRDYDGEVVLPQRFYFRDWQFWLGLFAWNPVATWKTLKVHWRRVRGKLDNSWFEFVLPAEDVALRRRHRRWACMVLFGHLALAAAFIATGHWFLIVVFSLGTQYAGLLGFLCGTPQHYGLSPNVPDHRLSCRTFTCSRFPAFLYWNMQYHIEHHMFPGVPFFNLPRLRKAIEHDLPPAPHGLRATWRHMLDIHRRQQVDPNYAFVPTLPGARGDRTDESVLEREALPTS